MKEIKLGKLEFDLDELRLFIVEAKKHCYAGEGEEEKMPDGSKRLIFQKGDFWYEDNYDGYYQAPGRELVKWQREDGQRIWQMAYSGGIVGPEICSPEKAYNIFVFLKKALMQIKPEMPFRGPEPGGFYEDGFAYFADTRILHTFAWRPPLFGEKFTRFCGEESIVFEGKDLFEQKYIGGLIMPK